MSESTSDSKNESTPIFEQTTAYLKDAEEADITHFEEDDNPSKLAGDFIDEDGDGVDDRKGK